MKAIYKKHILQFKTPSGTSRGVLTTKVTWFIVIYDGNNMGIGECGVFKGLSVDDRDDYETKLKWTCEHIDLGIETLLNDLEAFPSIQFGLEMAFISLKQKESMNLFPSQFTEGKDYIPINGLIWMGSKKDMKNQISDKIAEGYKCIKMKIGAISFEKELEILEDIRSHYDKDRIEIRVDANGAFTPDEALDKLKQLSNFQLHSIEQPIKQGQPKEMQYLCAQSPLPIALDEELIGCFSYDQKIKLLNTIKPQYIILKPTLIGGFSGTTDWIKLANQMNIGWWITSALESNIGLNAIAQFTYQLGVTMPQGLGTGSLFKNNINAPLLVKEGKLFNDLNRSWDLRWINI